MKKILLLPLFGTALLFTSFIDPYYQHIYPVFMSRADLEQSVKYHATGRELKSPGKIYSMPPYLYINEKYKGVHVINNTDPSKPINEGFIAVPGCLDMAIKDHMLYVDNAVDLVTFDLKLRKVTSRSINVFPEPNAPTFTSYPTRPEGLILVEWRTTNNQ